MQGGQRTHTWLSRIAKAVLFLVLLGGAWVAGGSIAAWSMNEPDYRSVRPMDGYTLREYPVLLAAQVSIRGSREVAMREGTTILSQYIHGDNTRQEAIAIAAPAGVEPGPESQRIALTAPVTLQEKNGAFLVSYLLPSSYTIVTLPRPNNPEIRIVQIPSVTVAARTWYGSNDLDRQKAEEQRLRELLARDKRVILSAARVAQYSPAWAPWFMQRNEILLSTRGGKTDSHR